MPDNAGLYQMMRQHRHCEPGGAADLNRVCIGRANAEMLGEDRRKHDMRRDGRITAEDAVDVCSRQAGIGNRKLGGLAHEVEGGRALMPAECRQSDAGDEAHGNSTSFDFVIPGWSEGPDPESRDSGFASSMRPGMTVKSRVHVLYEPQYDFGKPSTFSAIKLRMSCGLIGAIRGIRDSRK